MPKPTLHLLWILSVATPLSAQDFNTQIRPILSENCYHCHGPDAATRKAKLRLDLPPSPESIAEIAPRILSHDPDEIMPPPDSKRTLTSAQKSLLKSWAESGGEYQQHWAYVPPVKPDLSDDPNIHPIDHLLAPQIEESTLTPTPKADPATLIRRLTLDLTGLPPSPKEVEAFQQSAIRDPKSAIKNATDRLLASPRFGEKWARAWLDLARYADSNGFQADQLRDSWAYRDWVIDALNAGMPFDQFTIEQLAGDLLPNATISQKIATGFHRTVTCNVEAGVDPEENRVNQVVDRVNTTATVWLGATLECAQCHDHKYDPFTTGDYYSLFAYFNNTPLEVDNGGKGVSFSFTGPKIPVSATPKQEEQRQKILALIQSKEHALSEITGGGKAQRQQWERDVLAALESGETWHVLHPNKATGTGGETLEILKDGSILASGNVPDTTTYTVEAPTDLKGIRQFKIEALTHESIPGKGPGRGDAERSNFILSEFSAEADGTPMKFTRPAADFSQSGWEVEKSIDGDPRTGWAIAPQFGKPHHATFPTADPIGDGNATTLTFTLDQNYGRGRVLGCIRISATSADPTLRVPAEIASILRKLTAKRSKTEIQKLDAYYAAQNPNTATIKAEIAQLNKQLNSIKTPTTLVMVEMEKPRETHIMTRGNYLTPADKVTPAIPEIFHPTSPNPKSEIPTRLDLARWIVSKENPLTARVTVNRWWAEIFGQGIVATQEDFGTQSTPPTHPELLDYLATELIDSGWSMKHVLRLIVTSDAYQRSSHLPPDHLEIDPKNLLYARGSRFRMPAEMVRDNALAISGLLSTKMEGAPIMPYQPPGLWRQVGRNEPKWIEAKDENRYRRGIYIVYRRAAPYPSFTNFDAPDRASCTVDRPRTNTPLQALTLLNDPAYTEMAAALTGRLQKESPDPKDAESLIRTAYKIVLSRQPTEAELAYLKTIPAEKLATIFLNLDETITKG